MASIGVRAARGYTVLGLCSSFLGVPERDAVVSDPIWDRVAQEIPVNQKNLAQYPYCAMLDSQTLFALDADVAA